MLSWTRESQPPPMGATITAMFDLFTSYSTPTVFATSGAFLLFYFIGIVLSRLYLHPLSKFPGPRIAALTRWYEFYHDVIQDGTYVKYYPVLHEKLGPIVRTGPNHLHINDPEFYREVFQNQTRYLKAPYFYENLGITESLVGICDPVKHKLHRAIINPLFSKQSLRKLAPVVNQIVEHAAEITKQRSAHGQPIDIQKLYRCITVDVISTSLFGHTQDLTTQYGNDLFPEFLKSVDMFTDHMWLTKHFSFLNKLALSLPATWSEKIAPGYASFRSQCGQWIQDVKDRRAKGIFQTEDGRDTVFDLLLAPNPDKGYQVPTMDELVDEGFFLLVAGSDTTAYSIACATYYLLTHEDCQRKLKEELRNAPKKDNGELEWKDVSELQYLTAVVKESLRLSSGIPGILPRIVPTGGAQVKGEFIPEGTIVSISTRIIHDNAEIFPLPETFNPDRWLGNGGKELEKWNVSFSKGPRACIGLNLAYLEIYMTLAVFFSRFDMTLYETDASSMEWLDHGVASNRSYVKVIAQPAAAMATTNA